MENAQITHWSEQLKLFSNNDDKNAMVNIANGILDLILDRDFELIDTILLTFHPRYLSLSTMVLLLSTTQQIKDQLNHWYQFLIKSHAEIVRRSQDL